MYETYTYYIQPNNGLIKRRYWIIYYAVYGKCMGKHLGSFLGLTNIVCDIIYGGYIYDCMPTIYSKIL